MPFSGLCGDYPMLVKVNPASQTVGQRQRRRASIIPALRQSLVLTVQ